MHISVCATVTVHGVTGEVSQEGCKMQKCPYLQARGVAGVSASTTLFVVHRWITMHFQLDHIIVSAFYGPDSWFGWKKT